MAIQFRGRFETKMDPKGRLSLPSSFRQNLPSRSEPLVVTNGQFKGQRCLDVYSLTQWEALEARIQKLSPLKAEVQAFQRFYLAAGQVVEIDSQGRVITPQTLRQYAGLETELVLVGMGTKFEIWSAVTWNQLYSSLSQNFDDTLSAVASLELE
ncbi:MAG: division/cell wall cluster transcriptional repressor MraZ [Bdellovibrionia bacterium]